MKKWDAGTCILICAHNEEKNLGKTIDLIKQTGFSGKIVVVDDGSTDRTAQVAKRRNALVVSLPTNQGKAFAFFSGMRAIKELHPKAVVTFDADMESIPKKELQNLIQKAHAYTAQGKIASISSNVREGAARSSDQHSGIRAYSAEAVDGLARLRLSRFAKTDFVFTRGALEDRIKEYRRAPITGMGLEDFLNFYFNTKEGAVLERYYSLNPVTAQPAFRKDPAREVIQRNQLHWATKRIQDIHLRLEKRKEKAAARKMVAGKRI